MFSVPQPLIYLLKAETDAVCELSDLVLPLPSAPRPEMELKERFQLLVSLGLQTLALLAEPALSLL